ncbi:MAG: transporter substrate-binding protein [Oceanospirillaceae bacterium]|nr:transporter substrate-binding protein [Oceanospirillaceae bacterium]MCP5349663.1 transporter substrate-binding protein [Oceanospirillaceae bacterium]
MRAFQLTVLSLLLCAAAAGIWYFYRPEPPVQIVLITDEQGEYRLLSQGLQASLQRGLQNWRREYHIQLLPYASDLKALAQHFPPPAKIDLVIGCVDSPCARQVLGLLENTPVPFFFTGNSEGLLQHPRLWHLGAISNQSIFPALAMALQTHTGGIYFVGQESVQSRMQAALLSEYAQLHKATWQGEVFVRADSDWQTLRGDLQKQQPAILINAQCGLAGMALYEKIPRSKALIINTCLNEYEAALLAEHASGDWFLSVYQPGVDGFSQQEKMVSLAVGLLEPLQKKTFKASYLSIQLRNQNFLQGNDMSVVDNDNQHIWHDLYIYSMDTTGKLKTLYAQTFSQRPELVPSQRSPSQWELDALIYWRNRGGKWRE